MKSAMIAQNVEHAFPRIYILPWKAGKLKEEKMPSKMDVSDTNGLDGIGLDHRMGCQRC